MFFKVFNSCRVVKGAENSLIYDLERMGNSRSMPNSLYDILTEHKDKSVQEIKKFYNNEYDDVIDEYFEYLIKNEYIFYCSKEELELFPTLELTWSSPKEITNSIIDFDGSIPIENYRKFIVELSALGCEAIQLRCFNLITIDQIERFIKLFNETTVICVELILKYNPEISDEAIIALQAQYKRIRKVTFYSSIKETDDDIIKHLIKDINPEKDCGNIDSKYFSIGFDTFSEAQCHNTCLNQKISIDRSGCVKLCPSMKKSYGKIEETNIGDVLKLAKVKKIWAINKDEVEICKDCEYRYCCTDCRAFTDDSNNEYSRPSKCDYNPYLGLWKGEEGFVDVIDWLNKKKVSDEVL